MWSISKFTRAQPGDFLILGIDGRWSHMSKDDAVYCVGLWIEAQKKGKESSTRKVEIPSDDPRIFAICVHQFHHCTVGVLYSKAGSNLTDL